jgi:uncharacterized membrane protein YebE (DUF533 family)
MFDPKKLLDVFAGAAQQMNAGQQAGQGQGAAAGGLGGVADILGQVLGQATQGVREGAGRINEATGIGTGADDALRQATGQGAEELIGKVKDLMSQNQAATGAVLGGLAAILLGTRAGRGALGTAARLGGLALIGGLAYKALQNYQAGKPLLSGRDAPTEAAPLGSGFEPAATSSEAATSYLRAMIAAAMADGGIDEREAAKIAGAFQQAGLDREAAQFLQREYANPATPEDLAAGAQSSEVAMQIYTAASLAVDPRQSSNRMFLDALAASLGVDRQLAQHIDAQAMSAS